MEFTSIASVTATAKLSRRNLQLTEECLPVPAESRPTRQELDWGASSEMLKFPPKRFRLILPPRNVFYLSELRGHLSGFLSFFLTGEQFS